ncbi:MAG: DUF5702 domain-containing protein [Clostridia bacterium]|nr:DUF5702 domain-containing protein [Clostridia bacterium]
MTERQKNNKKRIIRYSGAIKGSISVFLAFILLPLLTVAGIVVDCARTEAAGTSMDVAGELTLLSALSEYDRVLYDVYGLFAISESEEELNANVTRYFKNTVENIGILESSDSYTRTFLNAFYGAMSEAAPAENLIKLTLDSFDISLVPSSSPANPAVMEKQILEYMKYRGPVNLAGGLLSKLASLGDLAAQARAAEKKINYETSLSKTEDYAKSAYEAIEQYKKASVKTGIPGSGVELVKKLEDAEKLVTAAVEMTAAASLEIKSDLTKTVVPSDYETRLKRLSEILRLLSDGGFEAEYGRVTDIKSIKPSGFADVISYDPDASADIRKNDYRFMSVSSDALEMLKYREICSEYAELYKTLLNNHGGDTLSEAEKERYNRIYEQVSGYLAETERLDALNAETSEKLKKGALGYLSAAAELIKNDIMAPVVAQKNAVSTAVEKLRLLDGVLDSLDREKAEWKDAIDRLENGEIKTGMSSDYAMNADGFDREKMARLLSVLEKDCEKLQALYEKTAGISLDGEAIAKNGTAGFAGDYEKLFEALSAEYQKDGRDFSETAEKYVSGHYSGKLGSFSALFKGYTNLDGNGTGTAFYRILKKRYEIPDKAGTVNAEGAGDIKELLVKAGTDAGKTPVSSEKNGRISEKVDEKILYEIKRLYDGAESESEFTGLVFGEADDSAIAEGAASGLGSVSELLGGIKDIGNATAETLLCGEYLTEMFSCATDPVRKRNGGDVLSLSGEDMSAGDCFGAEIEYILCGLDSLEANTAAARAMVFGVRFALNLLYVMTDGDSGSQTLAMAEAIAGWTGFGVPLVQNVILVTWALAETGVDLTLLMKDKSVAIFKSKTTWHLGFAGLKKTLAAGAAEAAVEITGDIFDAVSAFIADKSADGVDELTVKINDYADSVLDSAEEAVCDMLADPIGDLAAMLASGSEELGIDALCGKIDEIFENA